MFYYFRIEDHVPENHLLRAIDRCVSNDLVREKLKPFYRETGRPSRDPERLLRVLLIGYLYGVTNLGDISKWVKELQLSARPLPVSLERLFRRSAQLVRRPLT